MCELIECYEFLMGRSGGLKVLCLCDEGEEDKEG